MLERKFRGAAYPPGWRLLAVGLFLLSRGSLLVIALMVLAGTLFSPPLLFRLLVLLGLLPGLAAAGLRLAFAAEIKASRGSLMVRHRGLYRRGQESRVEGDGLGSLAISSPVVPVPGLSVTLESGQRWTLQLENPLGLLQPLGRESLANAAPVMLAHAEARATAGPPGWLHRLGKFGLFPLVPTFVIFRLHQYIMYGGFLGQYHLESPSAWLSGLVFHWALVLMYLALWAIFLRAVAEIVSLATARIAPHRALAARRWAERGVMLFFYGGPLGLIVLRSIT